MQLLSYFLLVCALSTPIAADGTQVNISTGAIQGGRCSVSGARQFLSIPYAQPPINELRFAPPQPYTQSFEGVFQATTAAVSCIQFGSQNAFYEKGPQSEDCLYLNVWIPGNASATSLLPVKVWIYGGSNIAGGISDPLYNGCNLATDAVVVSINYRLGPLGFLALNSAGVRGNMAIQDLEMGLRWVQTNIASFGGDPKKVVVFGQSAGAQDAFILSTRPSASSLMRAVIGESGAGRNYILTNSSSVQAYNVKFVEALGCGVSDLACLRAQPVDRLIAAVPLSSAVPDADNNAIVNSFQPSIDGQIIPEDPVEVGSQVPAIFGSTTMEATLFLLGDYTFPPSPQNYSDFLAANFGVWAPKINDTYSLDRFNNTPYPAFYALTAVYTDYAYKCPTYRALLQARANGKPAWAYRWALEPSCLWINGIPSDPLVLRLLNVTHTSELPFVFEQVQGLPRPNGTCNLTVYERQVSDTISAAWTSMARDGDPSRAGELAWTAFSSDNEYGLYVGASAMTVEELDFGACKFWNQINEGILANSTGSTNASSVASTGTSSSAPVTQTAGSSTVKAQQWYILLGCWVMIVLCAVG